MLHPSSRASLLLLPPSCSPARCVIQNPCVFRFPLASASPGLRAALAAVQRRCRSRDLLLCHLRVARVGDESVSFPGLEPTQPHVSAVRDAGRADAIPASWPLCPCVLPGSCPPLPHSCAGHAPFAARHRSSQPRPRRKIRKRFLFNLYKNSQL